VADLFLGTGRARGQNYGSAAGAVGGLDKKFEIVLALLEPRPAKTNPEAATPTAAE